METCLPGADVISPTLPPPVSSDQPLCCGDNPPTSTLPSLSPLAPLTTTSESDSDCDHHSQGRRFGESFFFFSSPLLFFFSLESILWLDFCEHIWSTLGVFPAQDLVWEGPYTSPSDFLSFFLSFSTACEFHLRLWVMSLQTNVNFLSSLTPFVRNIS